MVKYFVLNVQGSKLIEFLKGFVSYEAYMEANSVENFFRSFRVIYLNDHYYCDFTKPIKTH